MNHIEYYENQIKDLYRINKISGIFCRISVCWLVLSAIIAVISGLSVLLYPFILLLLCGFVVYDFLWIRKNRFRNKTGISPGDLHLSGLLSFVIALLLVFGGVCLLFVGFFFFRYFPDGAFIFIFTAITILLIVPVIVMKYLFCRKWEKIAEAMRTEVKFGCCKIDIPADLVLCKKESDSFTRVYRYVNGKRVDRMFYVRRTLVPGYKTISEMENSLLDDYKKADEWKKFRFKGTFKSTPLPLDVYSFVYRKTNKKAYLAMVKIPLSQSGSESAVSVNPEICSLIFYQFSKADFKSCLESFNYTVV